MTVTDPSGPVPDSTDALPTPEALPSPGGVEAFLGQRMAVLRGFVAELERDAVDRLRVSARLREDRAREACSVQSELWLLPDAPTVAGPRRLALEARLAGLVESERAEEVACWRDITGLGHERRLWVKEALELQARLALLQPTGRAEAYR
jgi:hypothetical protein